MHFEPDELLGALADLAAAEDLVARLDRDAMRDALVEARILAARPAAALYAFGRRSARFGPAGQPFVRGLTHAEALAIGCELEMSDVELAVHFAGLALGQIEFLELRGWIAARLRPLGQRRTPRRRARRWSRRSARALVIPLVAPSRKPLRATEDSNL